MLQNLGQYDSVLARSHSNYLAQINIELSQLSNGTNKVVNRLTFFATMAIPLNLVAGLFGMNVKVMVTWCALSMTVITVLTSLRRYLEWTTMIIPFLHTLLALWSYLSLLACTWLSDGICYRLSAADTIVAHPYNTLILSLFFFSFSSHIIAIPPTLRRYWIFWSYH